MHEPLQRLMRRHAVPGLQYLFAVGPELRVAHCAGFADALRETPVTPETTFNLYSITKPFTALAALMLAERGALSLDAPIAQAAAQPGLQGYGTVAQALLHRAGFANPLPLRWTHRAGDDASFDEPAFVRRTLALAARQRPRPGRAAYSNLGYLALGCALEQAGGRVCRAAIRQLALEPLGLEAGESLGFSITHPARHAHGHLRRWSLLDLVLGALVERHEIVDAVDRDWVRLHHHQLDGSAYGGLLGNASGLLRFGRALLGQGGDVPAGVRRNFLQPVLGPGPARSLGAFTGRLGPHAWVGHAGGGLGYYGELRLYPALGAVSVLLTNRAGLRDMRWLDQVDAPLLPPAA